MPRTGRQGFELCPHTCAPTGHCFSGSQTPLWRVEGSSLRRHLRLHRHSGCLQNCPAYGITDCHHLNKVFATPAQLQAYIPIIRRLHTISDSIISRSLRIDVSELSRRFPAAGKGFGVRGREEGSSNSEDRNEERETEDRGLYTEEEADRDIEGEVDSAEEILMDGNISGETDEDDDEYERSTEDLHQIPTDKSLPRANLGADTNPDNRKILLQLTPTAFSNRAHPTGPDVSGRFRVLYVPDPSRHANDPFETRVDLAFTTRVITRKQFENASSILPELIFHPSQGKIGRQDMVKARLFEWLWIMMRLDALKDNGKKLFDVSYMPWKTFKDGILTLDDNTIAHILSFDCIIGGIDYTIDYRSLYEWRNDKELESCLDNIENIRPPLRFWPPSHQVQYAGMKHKVIMDLSMIAARNKTFRPTTTVLTKPLDSRIPTDVVLKRSNSDCGSHVIMPGDSERRTREYLLSQTPNQETWVAQEYVHTFVEFGEWRVFIVQGHILHVVHTWIANSKKWTGRKVVSYWSLKDLWGMLHKSRTTSVPINKEHIHRADSGDIWTRNEAKTQFQTFVARTYQLLVDYEMRRQFGTPSISIFCRMDIGVIERNNSLHYFVNEVKRSTTGLWMDAFPDGNGILVISGFDWRRYL